MRFQKIGIEVHKTDKMTDQIEHEGTVIRIDDKRVYVRITQQSACAMCHAKGLCTASEAVEKIIEAERPTDTESVTLGDQVVVTGTTSMGLKAVFFAFVVPFCLLLGVLFAVRHFVPNDIVAGLGALAVLVPYYGILAALRHRMAAAFRFVIKKKSN